MNLADPSPTQDDALTAAAGRWPEAPFIVTAAGTRTFREVAIDVRRRAMELVGGGLAHGQCVALPGRGDYGFAVDLLALWECRAVACLVSTRWPEAAVNEALADLGKTAPISRFGGRRTLPPAGMDADAPATVIFTSGSTDRPKAALHTLGQHFASAMGANQALPLGPGDRWLWSLPAYHVGGLAILCRCLLAGATVVIDPAADGLAATVARHGVTHLSLVATQLQRLLADGRALPTLKLVLVGGGPVTAELLAEGRRAGVPVCATYGSTETSSQVCTARPDGPPDRLSLLPLRELKLAVDGEILVRGPVLFCGYLSHGHLLPAVDREGWYHTGDLGGLDAAGCLTVTGRRDLMFVSGGENIQPEAIERHLLALPGIRRALVVPVVDPTYGQRPIAFVESVDDSWPVTAWREALAARLPRFMIPDRFLAWPAEAVGPAAKPDRVAFARLTRGMQT